MANRISPATRIARKLARSSTAILVFFTLAAPAYADPIKYALVNAICCSSVRLREQPVRRPAGSSPAIFSRCLVRS